MQLLARPDSSPDLSKSNGAASGAVSKAGGGGSGPGGSGSLSNGGAAGAAGEPGDYLERRNNLALTNGSATTTEAVDEFHETAGTDAKTLNRSNSKSLGGGAGRDTSRKGREGGAARGGEGGAGKDGPPLTIKLESDVKRLKCDLQLSRNRENELRDQIVCYMSSKFCTKHKIGTW